MAGAIKTLADENYKISLSVTPPADMAAMTAVELNEMLDASCLLAANGTRLSATASDTISDPAICQSANASVPGSSNYEASLVPFAYFLDGKYVVEDNPVFEMVRERGATIYAYTRRGPAHDEPWDTGDIYSAFELVTDWPTESDGAGWIKYPTACETQRAELFKTVV